METLKQDGMSQAEAMRLIAHDVVINEVGKHLNECPLGKNVSDYLHKMEVKIDDIGTKMDKMHTALFIGNGTPSIAVRLDRIEQSHARNSVWISIIAVAVIGVIVTLVGEAVKSHFFSHTTASVPAKP